MATFLVVVVDDEADTRMMMWAFLHATMPDSVRVRTYADVEFRERHIDWDDCAVAIVDVMMPIVDGREILDFLAAEHPSTYRVAWTAASTALREELLETGLAHEVVVKPGLDEMKQILIGRV